MHLNEQTLHLDFSHDQPPFLIPSEVCKCTVHTRVRSIFVRKYVYMWYGAEEHRVWVRLPGSNSGSLL